MSSLDDDNYTDKYQFPKANLLLNIHDGNFRKTIEIKSVISICTDVLMSSGNY